MLRRVLQQPQPLATTARGFSAQESRRMKLPPNLIIDPKARKSPFFYTAGDALVEEIEEVEGDLEASEESGDESSVEASAEDSVEEDEEWEEDDDEEEEEDWYAEEMWFEAPKPIIAIPLPERLEVNILDKSDFVSTVGSLQLRPSLFGQDPVRVDIIKRVVQYQRNKKRGKRKAITKTISEVSGSGKKVRPQKGGGTSRAGHRRPAHWRGGAKAHGPKGKIQDYTTRLNKHVRKLGIVYALSQKLKEGNLMIVDDFMLESHKTKDLSAALKAVGLSDQDGKSAYLIDWATDDDGDGSEESLVYGGLPIRLSVAAGNLQRIKVSSQAYINVYDIMKHEKLVLSVSAVQALEERLGGVTY
jgi:large subunit ribosomal protein L4